MGLVTGLIAAGAGLAGTIGSQVAQGVSAADAARQQHVQNMANQQGIFNMMDQQGGIDEALYAAQRSGIGSGFDEATAQLQGTPTLLGDLYAQYQDDTTARDHLIAETTRAMKNAGAATGAIGDPAFAKGLQRNIFGLVAQDAQRRLGNRMSLAQLASGEAMGRAQGLGQLAIGKQSAIAGLYGQQIAGNFGRTRMRADVAGMLTDTAGQEQAATANTFGALANTFGQITQMGGKIAGSSAGGTATS